MSGEDREDYSTLLHMEVPPLGELLTEENLHYPGISLGLDKNFSIFRACRSLRHRLTFICARMRISAEAAQEAALWLTQRKWASEGDL